MDADVEVRKLAKISSHPVIVSYENVSISLTLSPDDFRLSFSAVQC